MREDVLLGPAGQVELGPDRQEIEAGLRQFHPAFPGQHRIQLGPHCMQVQHVAGGIVHLRLGELLGTPVRTLLGLVQLDAEQLADLLEEQAEALGPSEMSLDVECEDGVDTAVQDYEAACIAYADEGVEHPWAITAGPADGGLEIEVANEG